MMSSISSGSVNLILSVTLGIVFFGYIFFVIVGGLAVIGFFNTVFLKKAMKFTKSKQEATDKRINLLKNVLRNVNFIKINAWENLFMKSLDEARRNEMTRQIKVRASWIGINTLYNLGTPSIIIGFLYFFFKRGGELNVASVTILLRIFNLLEAAMMQLPAAVSCWGDMMVSVGRITLFLNSKELDYKKIRKEINLESEDAVKISDGGFYWDKKISKEDAEKIREEKIKQSKKKTKKLKAIKKINSAPSETSSLNTSLISEGDSEIFFQESERDTKNIKIGQDSDSFEMRGVNFRAKRGELTVLIGKIGSGKTTLLYSILGETMINEYNGEVEVNGTTCYLGQNPWLLNGTVKENILLKKEFDQEKFSWACKYSALEDDINTWDDKEDQEIGESGSSLSGGQRARIALARCLYQE